MKKTKKKRKNRPIKHIIQKMLLKYSLICGTILAVCLIFYCIYLSTEITRRFSGRRWNIPSRVFSDITLLRPGQQINILSLKNKLYQLGYREVKHAPKQKGDFKFSEDSLSLFLHDLNIPNQERNGFPVRIRFTQDRIQSISRIDNASSLQIIELEPEEIMLFYGSEHERRHIVSLDQVPQHVLYAVLAAEDKNFYTHHGLDPIGILRAFITNTIHGSVLQGGSTLTQQLAKNYFLSSEKTFVRKFNEILMSFIMEYTYTKNQIFEIYLNEIYLGQKGSASIAGIGEAAWFYFGKTVEELSLGEAAVIAGLIKAPNHYSPYKDKERCVNRRNTILQAMHDNKWITDSELQKVLQSSVYTSRFTPARNKAPYFVDYLTDQLKVVYSPEVLSSLGLSIYTTLDTQVQAAAEEALEKGLARLEKFNPTLKREEPEKKLQGAILVMYPKTGAILAMVGGRDYSLSQFNRITQARRQPGSAFKPFVYLSGLDMFSPSSMLSNEPKSFTINGYVWEPQNYEDIPETTLSVRSSLAKSVNLATLDLAQQVGFKHIISTSRAFRFSTPLKPCPSLPLGAFEIIPLELARAYCAFAASGILPHPMSLKKVFNEEGNVINQKHIAFERIISPEKSFIMNSLLRSVVTEGTARSLVTRGIAFPVAGKTGTTNDYRDAWFVGYTPDILALVWVGFDGGDSIHASGATAALPIWADLIKSVPQFNSGNWYTMPEGVLQVNICSETGQLPTSRCPHPEEEFFLTTRVPVDYCTLHQGTEIFKSIIKGFNSLIKKF